MSEAPPAERVASGGPLKGGSYAMHRINPKSEARNPKQFQMTKIQMTKTGDYDVLSAEFLSFENSGLNLFVSNFDIRYSDFQAITFTPDR
jgi:hypothetical protein